MLFFFNYSLVAQFVYLEKQKTTLLLRIHRRTIQTFPADISRYLIQDGHEMNLYAFVVASRTHQVRQVNVYFSWRNANNNKWARRR